MTGLIHPLKTLLIRIVTVCALILVSAVLGIYFHSVLHTEIIFTHFIYIPIVLASMWWGRKGILVALLLAALLFSFHLSGIAISPVWNDLVRMLFFVVVALCISALREAVIRSESALRLSEKKYRLLIDESFSGILVYRENRVLFTNSRFSEILQYSPDRLVQKSIWDLIYKDDRFKIQRLISKIEQKGSSVLHYECRFVREDGKLIWADVTRSKTIYEGAPA
ncbi:MAG TPA: PAS domain S-box protein, partial [Spirochaetia bacterium]|nr:PAS domain S-box protein [Spirochaetia bacterium]